MMNYNHIIKGDIGPLGWVPDNNEQLFSSDLYYKL